MHLKIKLTQSVNKVEISTEFIKLDAFLKFANAVMSGGEAKELILSGRVFVNGAVCTVRGKKLFKGDRVEINGKAFEVA